MQSQSMTGIVGLLAFVYFACVIGFIICLIRLLYRFITAHERIASALETLARKLKDDGKS